jgi:hypothetical protein
MVDVVALSPPRRRIQAYRAKHACFNMSETYDRLGLKHLQVPCIPTNTGYRLSLYFLFSSSVRRHG